MNELLRISVNEEFDKFKEEELRLSPNYIFEDCYKILCYSELAQFLQSEIVQLPTNKIEVLLKDRGNILKNLYEYCASTAGFDMCDWHEILFCVNSYVSEKSRQDEMCL